MICQRCNTNNLFLKNQGDGDFYSCENCNFYIDDEMYSFEINNISVAVLFKEKISHILLNDIDDSIEINTMISMNITEEKLRKLLLLI